MTTREEKYLRHNCKCPLVYISLQPTCCRPSDNTRTVRRRAGSSAHRVTRNEGETRQQFASLAVDVSCSGFCFCFCFCFCPCPCPSTSATQRSAQHAAQHSTAQHSIGEVVAGSAARFYICVSRRDGRRSLPTVWCRAARGRTRKARPTPHVCVTGHGAVAAPSPSPWP